MPKAAYDLTDEDLVKAISHLSERKLRLTGWEERFASGLRGQWIAKGAITWKQRRAARLLLGRVVERANRARTLTGVV